MPSINSSNIQNQRTHLAQKDLSEQRQNLAEDAAETDAGYNSLEDIVTLSTQQKPRIDFKPTTPSIPVSRAEMKALFKSFSVRV